MKESNNNNKIEDKKENKVVINKELDKEKKKTRDTMIAKLKNLKKKETFKKK
jgi:hypothetical protein